jgi:hypothetical protein
MQHWSFHCPCMSHHARHGTARPKLKTAKATADRSCALRSLFSVSLRSLPPPLWPTSRLYPPRLLPQRRAGEAAGSYERRATRGGRLYACPSSWKLLGRRGCDSDEAGIGLGWVGTPTVSLLLLRFGWVCRHPPAMPWQLHATASN